jgi:hypothetical protein
MKFQRIEREKFKGLREREISLKKEQENVEKKM